MVFEAQLKLFECALLNVGTAWLVCILLVGPATLTQLWHFMVL